MLSCEGTAVNIFVSRAAHSHVARQGSTKAGVGDFGFCFVFGKGQGRNYQIHITAFPEGKFTGCWFPKEALGKLQEREFCGLIALKSPE